MAMYNILVNVHRVCIPCPLLKASSRYRRSRRKQAMQVGPGHGHFDNAGCHCICLTGVERNEKALLGEGPCRRIAHVLADSLSEGGVAVQFRQGAITQE